MISDSVWMAHGNFLIAAGQQMYLFGEPFDSNPPVPLKAREESLFEQVARKNGPLEDYNPQMLLQCLLWGKLELVKEVIVNLSKDVSKRDDELEEEGEWILTNLPVERYLEHETVKPPVSNH